MPCKLWCERGDSNPHGFTRQILSLVRLPIPPLSHAHNYTKWLEFFRSIQRSGVPGWIQDSWAWKSGTGRHGLDRCGSCQKAPQPPLTAAHLDGAIRDGEIGRAHV